MAFAVCLLFYFAWDSGIQIAIPHISWLPLGFLIRVNPAFLSRAFTVLENLTLSGHGLPKAIYITP